MDFRSLPGLARFAMDLVTPLFGGLLAFVYHCSVEHGHHVFRACFKHAFLKRYEKFTTYLCNELVSNNLAGFQAQWLSPHKPHGSDCVWCMHDATFTQTDHDGSIKSYPGPPLPGSPMPGGCRSGARP